LTRVWRAHGFPRNIFHHMLNICDAISDFGYHADRLIGANLTALDEAPKYSATWADEATERNGITRRMSHRAKSEPTETSTPGRLVNIQRREELDEGALALLDTALEHQDGAAFLQALHVIVRAHGFAALSRKTGFNRTWLYKTISRSGNPRLVTILSLLPALGLRLCIQRSSKPPKNSIQNRQRLSD
jgi:probable addiction module antidote protein